MMTMNNKDSFRKMNQNLNFHIVLLSPKYNKLLSTITTYKGKMKPRNFSFPRCITVLILFT